MQANLRALTILRTLEAKKRAASSEEQAGLARWSGWGALPAVFDPQAASYEKFSWVREELSGLLEPKQIAAAQRSTINAHYTDAAYTRAIWGAVERLGFVTGDVLEPGCGCGNFITFAPEGARTMGVELEPITAAIAAAIHPHATIRIESFADTPMPEGSFDLVIGNVPFGDVVLHDRRHNVSGQRIHNHFILKSLHLTRPGGLVAVLTSRYTMDAINPSARRQMSELADLIGAVRLPTGAHRRAAGTDVVTDLLIFRRREDDAQVRGATFERALHAGVGGDDLRINEYFVEHPERVLGTLCVTQGDRGRPELGVDGDRSAGPALIAALDAIVDAARENELTLSQRLASIPHPIALGASPVHRPDGFLAYCDGQFTRIEEGVEVPYRPPSAQASELRALLRLRDEVVELLETEASSNDDTPELRSLRATLNSDYDRYVEAYGALNRFIERRTGRVDPTTQEERLARILPRQGGFRADPYANVVYALEHFDSSTQIAAKATLFHERVICRPERRLGADTPADALSICLDVAGEVRVDEVARLLGVSSAEARAQLGTLVFDEPGTDRHVPAAEYLSGNVRQKLRRAEAAQVLDARFSANVAALSAVIPRDLGPDEIRAQLGAAWIDRRYVEHFLREILDDASVRVEHPGGAMWTVRSNHPGSVQATSLWGTERYAATAIAQALLEQRSIRIYDENSTGQRVFNPEQTLAATEKATEMSERFSEWIWEDPERAASLARTYNDSFNAIVPRSYDAVKLTLPGLAITFKPFPHQVAAVARIIHEPAVGLFHEVGAGKTAEMVMGAMELRRLGLAKKPVVVVPNHMLEQFSREWLQMYPQAKLLAAATEDLDRERRRLFVAKCATGDWDAVVMTRSAFERIPMSPKAQLEYLEREVEGIEGLLDRARSMGASVSLKRIEKMKANAEERIKSKLDSVKDPGITFEQLGVDYLLVDEAHAYKNLRTTSNIPGMAVDGSQRASDLHMKIEYLRARYGRCATLATATPIANSMAEAYTMQRYLRPDLLHDVGIRDFDHWAATFGRATTGIEVAPDGSGMRMQTRFKFSNLPELLQLWRVSADIKTAEDLKLPVPALALRDDGERLPETVVVRPSARLLSYVQELAARAEAIRNRRVDLDMDNMLKLSSDGRAAGLDLRLLGADPGEPQKVEVAAHRIAAIYEQHREAKYPAHDGTIHPRPGALQLVFSDLGTPKSDRWNVYDELKSQLVQRGVPRDAIRFMHEAKNDREKAELFAACRDGRIAVLVGSTERMGVGTNVQRRAVALHHLDCPWRPADIAQREGRILRHGNSNPEIQILRYVTERSFDAYVWQTVSHKAQRDAQVLRGRLDVREIDDIGEAALSYNEVKALATGNPLLLEHARTQAEVTRLERLQRAHARNQELLRWTLQRGVRRRAELTDMLRAADEVVARGVLEAQNAELILTIAGRTYDNRSEANDALRQAFLHRLNLRAGGEDPTRVGELHGFAITLAPNWLSRSATLALHGVPESEVTLSAEELPRTSLVTRLENRLFKVPQLRERAVAELQRCNTEQSRANTELAKPSRYVQPLDAARRAFAKLDRRLSEMNVPATGVGLTDPAQRPAARIEREIARGRRGR